MSADAFGAGGTDAQQTLQSFWPRVMEEIRNLTVKDFRVQELPLARIKKIMKLDEDVKMISAEAPVLFAKAAQIFITELTLRAWIHTEDNKRRTLQPGTVQVQQQQGQQAGQATTTTLQPGQIIIAQPQQGQVQLNTGQLQYIRLAQPVSGTQVV
ncbi:hypothetical protein CRUP_024550, partial [Coryphaenoides rupestris]